MPLSSPHRVPFFQGACLLARWAAGPSMARTKWLWVCWRPHQVRERLTRILNIAINAHCGSLCVCSIRPLSFWLGWDADAQGNRREHTQKWTWEKQKSAFIFQLTAGFCDWDPFFNHDGFWKLLCLSSINVFSKFGGQIKGAEHGG